MFTVLLGGVMFVWHTGTIDDISAECYYIKSINLIWQACIWPKFNSPGSSFNSPSGTKKIECMNMNGDPLTRFTVFPSSNYPFSIASFGFKLYWSDWDT